MAITSTEIANMLGMTTLESRYTQVETLLPFILIQINDYCAGGFSRQIKEEEVTTAATTTSRQLTNYPVVKGSVFVTSTDRGDVYYGDTQYGDLPVPDYYIPSTYIRDFDIGYTTGGFVTNTTAAGGRIPASTYVYVTYSFVDLVDGGKVACARIINQIVNQPGGIASESVGTLSRAYVGGMDSLTLSMLAPYKRPRVI